MTTDQKPAQAATLVWGVKQSFCGYVEAMGGVIETGAGATRGADGGFVFAAAPDAELSLDAEGRPVGRAMFLGEVRFDAHGGMLKVFLADPAVEITETGAVLTVADTAKRTRRMAIAQLDLNAISPGEGGEIVIPCALTVDGCQILGDHYQARTPIDPVRLSLGR
jgi:hypothetical protein